jgi:uncharacterized protein (TIGR04255 family)
MDWEPAHADHSIDSVTAVVMLGAPIDPNTFDEIVVAGRKASAAHQFVHRVDGIEPTQIQPGAQLVLDASNWNHRRRVAFQRHVDGAVIGEFAIGVTSLVFASSRYSTWTAFKNTAFGLMNSVNNVSPILDNVSSIQLQYMDSFTSTKLSADHFEVISKTSDFVARALDDKSHAFHCHSGWFDYADDRRRNLTNVNIGVVDNSPPALPDAMSRISILTMSRMEALTGVLNAPLEHIQISHDYLKKLIEDIITPEAAARISLND